MNARLAMTGAGPLGRLPLSVHLSRGREAFNRAAARLAELEQAADLEPGSLVESLVGGFAFEQAEQAGAAAAYILDGWDCPRPAADVEAAVNAIVESWNK